MTLKVPRCEFVHGLKCEDVSRRITQLEQERDSAREQLHNALDDTRWLNEQNATLRALCRDMFLVVACMDLDGSQLHTHGVDADWRTLRERYDELMGYEGEVCE